MKARTIMALSWCMGLGLLWLAGASHEDLRTRRGPAGAETGLKGAPPAMTVAMVALGGFRGLVADVLWLRLSHLQERGEFFEMVQLAEWVSKLQPHTAEIWEYHAWNLAYNVSVMLPDYEDRWRWVWHGVTLLRDEGLVYNPREPRLYVQLGWMFQHKIAGTADTAHELYQRRLADKVLDVLGAARPDFETLAPERVRRLREDLRMDAERMRAVDERYGPLDWTRAEAHAVYWAYLGMVRNPEADLTGCRRMIRQSLAALAVDS